MRALAAVPLLRDLLDYVLPPLCAACDAALPPRDRAASPRRIPRHAPWPEELEARAFCDHCLVGVEPTWHACPRCALPAPPPTPGSACPPCIGCQTRPPPWQEARAPFVYSGALATAVRRWKLGPDPALTRPLAGLLAPSLVAFAHAAAFVPVPLHPRRLRERAFNQSSDLIRMARAAARFPLPPVEEWLDRVIDTPHQLALDPSERRKSLRGAFAVPRPERVSGRHVILVDDVLTTGATAAECTRALSRAGAARVSVLTLARTLP